MRNYKPSTQCMLSLERRLQIVSYRWCQKLRSIMPKFTVKVTHLRISHNRKHVNSTGLHFLLFLTIVHKHYGVRNKWVHLSLDYSRRCILLLLTCLPPSLFIIRFPDKISNKKKFVVKNLQHYDKNRIMGIERGGKKLKPYFYVHINKEGHPLSMPPVYLQVWY